MLYFCAGLFIGVFLGFIICTILTASKLEELSYYKAKEKYNGTNTRNN